MLSLPVAIPRRPCYIIQIGLEKNTGLNFKGMKKQLRRERQSCRVFLFPFPLSPFPPSSYS